jgi:hypothetical protein
MATIITKDEGSLLIVYVSGILTAEEVTSVFDKYFTNEVVKDVIWDISVGSLGAITEDGYKTIAYAANQAIKSGARKGGKTAFIGHADLEYSLLKMYAGIAKETGVPIKYKVFKNIDKAREWIIGM